MTLTTEFEVFDTVYVLHGDDIVECSVREIHLPYPTRHIPLPTSDTIQYGLLTKEKLAFYTDGGIFEGHENYIWKFASQIGRSREDLLTKMLNNGK